MRTPNPEAQKAIWVSRFLRVVMTRKPSYRFRLDHGLIDSMYVKQRDPVVAALRYLSEKASCTPS